MAVDIAIKVENLSKYYRLGVINNGTLFRDFQSWWARRLGKDDPHSKLCSKYDSSSEGFWALKNLNFEIKKGDRVGIIGHNGAGKSTLLKLLSQITSPTDGCIKINGRIASLLEVGTGFHPEMTGRENIYMNGAILGMSHAEINKKIKAIIEFSEIGNHIDTPVKRYSSGMYVRLAFAVAAYLDSDILIADEVLAVGDASFQKKALGKMNELSTGEGRTVLFVSHNMAQVKALCTKGMILNHGSLAYSGDISKCVQEYLSMNVTKEKKDFFFSNEYFDLVDFFISDKEEKRINSAIENDGDAYVNIKFNYKKDHAAFCIGYAAYTDSGDCLYWSYTTDVEESRWIHFNIGENLIRSKLPNHFFNEGNYTIRVIASLHFIEWFLHPDTAPFLEIVIRGGLSKSPYWYMAREGICAPVLEWEKV